MAFWIYCTAMCLLVPLIMMYFGWRFLKNPPKRMNSFYGYRTHRSMKNQQTWDFAHEACGKIWVRTGIVMLPVSFVLMLPSLGQGVTQVGVWCVVTVILQMLVMLGTIIPVERALKQNFDQFGRKR